MAFRLNDEGTPSPEGDGEEIQRWKQRLESGPATQKERAARRLVELRAEEALTECLAATDPLAVKLATGALWECWMNEQGPTARREMDKGISKMNGGDLEGALDIFAKLVKRYPSWAEAYNKQATALYLLGNARLSLKVAQVVVSLKPNHFGAWNGMALCAAHLERWQVALDAARKALSLQPTAQANLDLIQLAQTKLSDQS
jgi:tetratricopeptide (TPR) repeat protein